MKLATDTHGRTQNFDVIDPLPPSKWRARPVGKNNVILLFYQKMLVKNLPCLGMSVWVRG
jgi:hypothetical protein